MTVKAILADKGRDVVTIDATATLAAASQRLAQHRVGALVIVDRDARIAGILSERDVVAALAARGAAGLDATVAGVMTRNVATCSEGDTMAVLMERMTTGRFRHLPVVEDGRLAGIISIGDVVKSRLREIEQESTALRDYIQTA